MVRCPRVLTLVEIDFEFGGVEAGDLADGELEVVVVEFVVLVEVLALLGEDFEVGERDEVLDF